MKTIKILFLLICIITTKLAFSQELPAEINTAIINDNVSKLASFVTKDNINTCYGNYSLLSQTIRSNAKKCFDLLIEKGANVNLSCNGYVPPLMHAAKYGRLDMVKVLAAKGADINYKYSGNYTDADGETPITYAEKFEHKEIADYLNSLMDKK